MVGIPGVSYNERSGDALSLATKPGDVPMTQTIANEQYAPGQTSFAGGCFCGAVQIRLTGAPVAMGYCHCQSCRHWSAGPVNAFTLWKPESLEIAKGRDQLASYHRTDRSHRKSCQACGGHLLTEHPAWGLVDVYAAVLPEFPFQPALHVNYAERVLPIKDGLPKQRDLPKEMGGSGTIIAE
jgi:hypothetical protein